MEDKWFIYYENETLHIHRSWTGILVFQLIFSSQDNTSRVIKTIVNRDITEYNQQDDNYDIKFLNFLIDRLLLNKQVPFPTQDSIEPGKQDIYRHAMIGNARSNNEE